jgi:hypothetical protein
VRRRRRKVEEAEEEIKASEWLSVAAFHPQSGLADSFEAIKYWLDEWWREKREALKTKGGRKSGWRGTRREGKRKAERRISSSLADRLSETIPPRLKFLNV